MSRDNSRLFLLAVEIAAATFRVAALVRHRRLREELEEAAIMLVKFLKEESAARLGRLIGLAEAIEEMNETNAEVLLRELENFQEFFGQDGQDGQLSRRKFARTRERQAAILEFTRRFPESCPVEDLFLEFAFVSPRTLRRDLDELARRGFLKRKGNLLSHRG